MGIAMSSLWHMQRREQNWIQSFGRIKWREETTAQLRRCGLNSSDSGLSDKFLWLQQWTFRFHIMRRSSLSIWATISFSKWTQFHRASSLTALL
jgi:hypothetical protein